MCSENFHSPLKASKELNQALTKPSQSNITSAKRQQHAQKQKWQSAFIYIYFSPPLNTERVAPPKQKTGTQHPMKEFAFPSSAQAAWKRLSIP